MNQTIKIVHYKAGNIASVQNALQRLGVTAGLAAYPDDLKQADKLIFPGVGHARPAMEVLKQQGMDEAISKFNGPVLGICLGMQLMAASSEEGNMEGLGIFPEKIKRFTGGLKIPHMGWNSLFTLKSPLFKGVLENSHVYFVHSYYMPQSSRAIALCRYDQPFTAAISHEQFFGLQFHPEKSGKPGMQILQNFIDL